MPFEPICIAGEQTGTKGVSTLLIWEIEITKGVSPEQQAGKFRLDQWSPKWGVCIPWGAQDYSKLFFLIVACKVKKVWRPWINIYHNTPPLPCCSVCRVQGANRINHCRGTLNLVMNRKNSETGWAHEKEMTRERSLMTGFLHIHETEANICPVDKQISKGWHESVFAKGLFSVFKVILWRPPHECWQMVISGIVNVRFFSIKTHILVPFRKQNLCL